MTKVRLAQALVVSFVLSIVLLPSIFGGAATCPASQKPVAAMVDNAAEPAALAADECALPGMQAGFVAQGCGFWNGGGGAQTEQALSQIGMCVFEQLLQGITDPGTIAVACNNITLSQVLAELDSILKFYTTPQASDAGAPVADAGGSTPAYALCGTGAPPIQGAAQCVSSTFITNVRAVRMVVASKLVGQH